MLAHVLAVVVALFIALGSTEGALLRSRSSSEQDEQDERSLQDAANVITDLGCAMGSPFDYTVYSFTTDNVAIETNSVTGKKLPNSTLSFMTRIRCSFSTWCLFNTGVTTLRCDGYIPNPTGKPYQEHGFFCGTTGGVTTNSQFFLSATGDAIMSCIVRPRPPNGENSNILWWGWDYYDYLGIIINRFTCNT